VKKEVVMVEDCDQQCLMLLICCLAISDSENVEFFITAIGKTLGHFEIFILSLILGKTTAFGKARWEVESSGVTVVVAAEPSESSACKNTISDHHQHTAELTHSGQPSHIAMT
jgi:hypothetical protein